MHPGQLHRLRRVRLVSQPRDPGREPGWRVNLVGWPQPETVLVEAGIPLMMGLKLGGMQAYGGRDRVGHAVTVPARAACKLGRRYLFGLGIHPLRKSSD
jgi:hypothetical protein